MDGLAKVITKAQQEVLTDGLPIFPPSQLVQGGWVANRCAEAMPLGAAIKLQLLGELDPLKRLEAVTQLSQ